MLWLTALLGAVAPVVGAAEQKQTVCTITVNSADEKEVFRRHLPASKYQFVELVEKGRSDWLASSCSAATRCDVLIVSGHFDGDNEFFSDQIEAREYATVSELERNSCSASCPGVFSQLKEVYLFGCNTLNPRAQSIGFADSPLQSQVQDEHAQSSRDRMRELFAGVPVIYGFASTAPLGPVAGATLERYFSRNKPRIGTGRADPGLLRAFSAFSLASASGAKPGTPTMAARGDMCRFADDRLSVAQKLDFVHDLMRRPDHSATRHLGRIGRLAATLDADTRAQGPVARVLADIGSDSATRSRFLADARANAHAPARSRLVGLARDLGWLDETERRQELAKMLDELQSRKTVGMSEIDLACRLNKNGELDGAIDFRSRTAGGSVPHAALRACLGSTEDRAHLLDALASVREADVQIAQSYLRRRPITDMAELQRVTRRIVEMPAGDAQVRALEALGRHYVSDRKVLLMLARQYARTSSFDVQNAIAGVLLRADRRSIDEAELRQVLSEHRRRPARGGEMVDVLLSRLDNG